MRELNPKNVPPWFEREATTMIESSSENYSEMGEEEEEEERKRKEKLKEKPPEDDCCPICFGDFTVSCKTNCGHWFCGNCILQLWMYRGALRACKCPICTCSISKLTPEASLFFRQEKEVVDLLKAIQRYNRLYVGGFHGLLLKIPLLLRRIFWAMMEMFLDPHQIRLNYNIMRLVAILLGWIYSICDFDFIPTGRLGIYGLFDTCGVIVVVILFFAGLYRKWVRGRRVRRLAMEEAWPN